MDTTLSFFGKGYVVVTESTKDATGHWEQADRDLYADYVEPVVIEVWSDEFPEVSIKLSTHVSSDPNNPDYRLDLAIVEYKLRPAELRVLHSYLGFLVSQLTDEDIEDDENKETAARLRSMLEDVERRKRRKSAP